VVGDVDCPEPRAGADVEDTFRAGDGREEQFVVQCEEPEVVDDGFVGLVFLVIGRVVGAVAVGVVAPAVFVAVAGYVGGEGAAAGGGVGFAVPFCVGVFGVVAVGCVLGCLVWDVDRN
jgi:hypothetical protein